MPSSKAALLFAATLLVVSASASRAQAQQPQGFAVERLYQAAPGGGWIVMDDLDMHGRLGGAAAISSGYAYKPLQVASADGSQHLAVVSHQAFVDVGLAVTYDRFRIYLNLTSPLVLAGDSGSVGAYSLAAPSVDAGKNPDSLSDARFGFDARLVGDAKGPFRLGAGAQLIVPSGDRTDYITDGTYRAMGRVLFAGDVGVFKYAGHLGVHVRPLDDSPAPGSPRGSELLFGVAAGPKVAVGSSGNAVIVVGPEIYGVTAFSSFLGSTATGVEGLLTGRLEGTAERGPQLRLKVGTGGGINPHFGAPEWRIVFGIEVFDHRGE